MKKVPVLLLCVPLTFGPVVIADDRTIGIGLGPLYGGFGMNLGLVNEERLRYLALGCVSASYSSGTDDSELDTNCGVAAGIVSSDPLPGQRHALGLSLGVTYQTDEDSGFGGGAELHVSPNYYFFFNGLGKSGFNLGIGPGLDLYEGGETEGDLRFNAGFQF